jgi:hypothetical protein
MRLRVAWLASLAVVAGCTSSTTAQSTVRLHATSPAAPLSVRVVLPSRTMAAGSHMSGRVVVNNRTGRAIHVGACGLPFMVALSSRTYHPTVAWLACAHIFRIPAGSSSYRVEILASYLACGLRGAPSCLPGKQKIPPLPAGRYQAKLFFQGKEFGPAPPSIPLRVTPK